MFARFGWRLEKVDDHSRSILITLTIHFHSILAPLTINLQVSIVLFAAVIIYLFSQFIFYRIVCFFVAPAVISLTVWVLLETSESLTMEPFLLLSSFK